MNYFAHGRRFVDAPYFLAGTAVPDWLNVADRSVRVRARRAQPFVADPDPVVRQVARGIAQHHHDDGWFHQTRAFVELHAEFTQSILARFPSDRGPRAGFLGHILVEILLDAVLIEDHAAGLAEYYRAVEQVDSAEVERAVNRMAPTQTDRLAPLIPRFSAERFLYDYACDAKLLRRLGAVLRRVGLPELPDEFRDWLPGARDRIRMRQAELLSG